MIIFNFTSMKINVLTLFILIAMIFADSCKKHEDPPVVYYTASATIKGTLVQFKTTSTFSHLCIFSGVCNTFYVDPYNGLVNYIIIGLPKDVYTGMDLKNGDGGIQILYTDVNGRQYFSSKFDSLKIHVDEWQGHGGWGKGTFMAKLRYSGSQPPLNDSLTITNGNFSSRIWYYFQN